MSNINPIYRNPVRHPEDTGVSIIGREVTFSTPAPNGLIAIGAFEKNSVVLRAGVTIVTAFNAGTTNVLQVGTDTTAEAYITAANSAAGTAGNNKQGTGVNIGAPLATDTILYARFTQTGTAATAGRAIIWVEAFVPRTEDPRTRAAI